MRLTQATRECRRAAAAALVLCFVMEPSAILAGKKSKSEPSKFLAPAELAELADKSKVSYGTTILKSDAELPAFVHPGYPHDGPLPATRYPRIGKGQNGSRYLSSFVLSAVAQKALAEAEIHFEAKEYPQALAIYREALKQDPDCYLLHLNAGDCYLFSGNPLAALDSYDRAVELNPDDFHGHWFRASALVELGRPEKARRSYARALAMSPHHPALLQAINTRADRLGFRARESLLHPLAVARQEGDVFRVYTVGNSVHWWIYGLCRAIWVAEADHRKDLTGKTEHIWTAAEELECTANLLASYGTDRDTGKEPAEPELDLLLRVLDAHSLGAFVNYEFGSRVTGDYSILLDPDSLDRVVDFVDQFVFYTP